MDIRRLHVPWIKVPDPKSPSLSLHLSQLECFVHFVHPWLHWWFCICGLSQGLGLRSDFLEKNRKNLNITCIWPASGKTTTHFYTTTAAVGTHQRTNILKEIGHRENDVPSGVGCSGFLCAAATSWSLLTGNNILPQKSNPAFNFHQKNWKYVNY